MKTPKEHLADNPLVSVIIPAYNEAGTIEKCLSSLNDQSYTNYEVLVVDNGSTDNTVSISQSFNVDIIEETDKQGSYAARNTGLQYATGDIIAFTDADCIPEKHWLRNAIQTFSREEMELLGGQIRFQCAEPPSATDQFECAFNLQVEKSIKSRTVAPTANLFVKKEVFEEVGTFPTNFRSGGDLFWTEKATTHGYKISFDSEAIVEHPTRSFKELLKKHNRTGWGQSETLFAKLRSKEFSYILQWSRNLIPCPPFILHKQLASSNQIDYGKVSFIRFYHILIIVWMCQLSQNIGRLLYFHNNIFS